MKKTFLQFKLTDTLKTVIIDRWDGFKEKRNNQTFLVIKKKKNNNRQVSLKLYMKPCRRHIKKVAWKT